MANGTHALMGDRGKERERGEEREKEREEREKERERREKEREKPFAGKAPLLPTQKWNLRNVSPPLPP